MNENPWLRSQPTDTPVNPVVTTAVPVVPVWGGQNAYVPYERVLLVGAHAGAGVSSLSAVTGIAECGFNWGVPSSNDGVVFVARGDMRGLNALSDAGRAWSEGRVKGRLLGAVVLADHPKELKELKTFREFVCRGFPQSWFIPFIDSWRLAPGSKQGLPKAAVKAFTHLSSLTTTEKR
ncbi:MAG: hypothetical protein Q4D73_06620 [Actinomycetaceae bacterium]|nr:hypothetical protein [Actinomycetaceae bacterium]